MPGCTRLGSMESAMNSAQSNPTEAVALLQRSCNSGEMEGCSDLADLYMDGRVVQRDPRLARQLNKKACDGGYIPACAKPGGRPY
jgi:uncharacterized protein